jgi:hypothetical protein
MNRTAWLVALAVLATPAAAEAQAVAPEPAPPAQRAAPPDKIGAPLHAKEPPAARIRRDETTGVAPKELAPGHGDAATSPRKNDGGKPDGDAVPSR